MRSNTIPVDTTKPETVLRLSLEGDLRVATVEEQNRDSESLFIKMAPLPGIVLPLLLIDLV